MDMYKIAENENIDILNYNWTNSKAKIFEIDNNYYIALDNKQISTNIEEKEILAEELVIIIAMLYIILTQIKFKKINVSLGL